MAGVDVVHVQDTLYATSLPALLLARRRGIPSVLTQHVAFVPQAKPLVDGAQRAAIATLGHCARLASAVATYNPAVADWVTQRWGIEDVRVLPVGVDSRSPAGRSAQPRSRASFGLPENRFLALFVGRDVPKKGLDLFLGAHDPAYELVAVTDRPATSTVAKLLGFMSPERLQSLMRCVDAFVLPSEAEGFPLSLQEALANGLPVVTTRQPGYEHYLAPDDVLFVDAGRGVDPRGSETAGGRRGLAHTALRPVARSGASALRRRRVRQGVRGAVRGRFERRGPVAEAAWRNAPRRTLRPRQNEGQGRNASGCLTIEEVLEIHAADRPVLSPRLRAVRTPQPRRPSRRARSGSGAGSASARPFASCGRSAS